jgi:hypothetical protein
MMSNFAGLDGSGNELACYYSTSDRVTGLYNRRDPRASAGELIVAPAASSIILREVRIGRVCIFNSRKEIEVALVPP